MVNPYASLTLFGTTQPVPRSRRLAAGALSCELREGQIRHVRWDGVEILRSISYVLRDAQWATVPSRVSGLSIEDTGSTFRVRFELRMTAPGGTLSVAARIEGRADGQLSFDAQATADTPMRTNRCGFAVLHPSAIAGADLLVRHADGSQRRTVFPASIAPDAPVDDIRSLTWTVEGDAEVTLSLQADLPGEPRARFVMIDQRNWSEPSFNTHARSHEGAWPLELPAGVPLSQSVSLQVIGSAGVRVFGHDEMQVARVGARGNARMPAIGVGVSAGIQGARADEHACLRALGAQWWMVEAALDDPGIDQDLACIARLRAGLPVQVQLDLMLPAGMPPEDAATAAAAHCRSAGLVPNAVRLVPFETLRGLGSGALPPAVAPAARYAAAIREAFPGALVGAGTLTGFAELNRLQMPADGLDFIGHPTCPIMFAADDDSVMQSLSTLPDIVATVRERWPTLGYRLGTSGIALRHNAHGDQPAANPLLERRTMAGQDPRHDGQFGAAWVAGYAARVAPLGLQVLALLDAHGPRGPFGSGMTPSSPTGPREPVRAWAMLRMLASAQGAACVPVLGLPAGVAGVAWTRDGRSVRGLLANLSDDWEGWTWAHPVSVNDAEPGRSTSLGAYETVSFGAHLGALP